MKNFETPLNLGQMDPNLLSKYGIMTSNIKTNVAKLGYIFAPQNMTLRDGYGF